MTKKLTKLSVFGVNILDNADADEADRTKAIFSEYFSQDYASKRDGLVAYKTPNSIVVGAVHEKDSNLSFYERNSIRLKIENIMLAHNIEPSVEEGLFSCFVDADGNIKSDKPEPETSKPEKPKPAGKP